MILDKLRLIFDERHEEMEAWLREKRKAAAPFITTSVDLRHSGGRLVPVDTNIYPAGFQNLSANGERRAASQFKSGILAHAPHAKRVLIVPENHTRNLPYFENLATLKRIIEGAGFEVELGNLTAALEFETAAGVKIQQHGLVRNGASIATTEGFVPDVIILNNDLSGGAPPLLEGLTQPVLPPVRMGWFQRLKSAHFHAYCGLAGEFAEAFGLDKWTICAQFKAISNVNFKTRENVEALAQAVDDIIATAAKKHAEYGITDAPYAYVKADSGTYGMGILVVKSGADILEMNKKERNKMHVIKEGVEVSNVIVQEGIPTIDTVDGKPAEPMMYLVDGVPIGGMYRINGARDAYGNLNAAGMEFKGMCDEMESYDCRTKIKDCDFRVYGIIAAIAALAAGRE